MSPLFSWTAAAGEKLRASLTFLDTLAERELNSIYNAKDGDMRDGAGRVRPFVPSRLDSPEKAGSFVDAARYMPSRMAAAYEDPSVIEKLEPPKPPRARMYCVDYIALLERYDDIDMLDFALADSLPGDQAAGQFPNSKSDDVDRLISNRRPRNSQE